MIIDSHTHIFNREVGGAEENFPLWPGTRWGGSGVDLLKQMDEAGIQKAVLISYTPVDVMSHYPPEKRDHMVAVFQHYLTRDYFVRTWQDYPDRFFWFADSIDPRVPGYVERAGADLALGADGLKLLPLFVDTELSDPRWLPIFELLRERGRPCIVDLSWWYIDRPGFAPSVCGKYASYADYVSGLVDLASRFPEVRIQVAHYGTPELHEGNKFHYDRLKGPVELLRSFPNLYCDLAAYQHLISADEPYPYWSALKIIEILVEEIGAEKIHWGTDWPYLGERPYTDLINAIQSAEFVGQEQRDRILGQNFLSFIGGEQ